MHYATKTQETFYSEIRWFLPGDAMQTVERYLTNSWWKKLSVLEDRIVLAWAGHLVKWAHGEDVRDFFLDVPVFVSKPHQHMLELSQQTGFDTEEERQFDRVDNVYTAFNAIKIAARTERERVEEHSGGTYTVHAPHSLGAAHNYRQIGRRVARHYGFTKEGWERRAF
ncbi:hypothetical protein RTBOTA2_004571 [Rhodotorula toruloides]|uniref:Uncharacterized protein n=1 Tax=Rhodotorula toruloides TaxID=5286 RepID=A0A0K3CNH2_RHOTO|nr:hypothetical protein RTBOTA2_004571 [Rhodotorula toruloides]PRQ73446.1 hypothetical protein AAT19DRAFT_16199 [Rhodotorula toruloides]